MKVSLSTNGQITLPDEFRDRDQLRAGERFEFVRLSAGNYLLRRLVSSTCEGTVDWLLACPEKGWFESLPSESTEAL
jgi:bifunctional DNA-binding transcriptional regulator/antitoxin component of YhaV-PrlF toxin-antitoxin module